ncbi:MAG: hypothetical protein ABI190_05400 [Casimicrobiaceae bacterium]
MRCNHCITCRTNADSAGTRAHAWRIDGARRSLSLAILTRGEPFVHASAWFVEPAANANEPLPVATMRLHGRFARQLRLAWQTLPYLLGRHKACADFRNVVSACD